MNLKRLAAALAISAFALLMTAGVAGATAHPPFWTDGSTFSGPTNFGPPPMPAKWQDPCDILLIDPPTFVFITVHATDEGHGGPDLDEIVGSEYDSAVFPYTSHAPGMVAVNVHDLVDGHKGVIILTWNIGTGMSVPMDFDCKPPASTTTTTTSTTTVTSPPQCLLPEGCTTTTTAAPVATTVPHAGPSTTVQLGTAVSTSSGTGSLPMTGGTPWPLATVGACAVGAGTAMVRKSRRHSR
jgi:hypothetical protein